MRLSERTHRHAAIDSCFPLGEAYVVHVSAGQRLRHTADDSSGPLDPESHDSWLLPASPDVSGRSGWLLVSD